MEQITREEMIELLNVAACPASCVKGVIVRDELHGEIEQCQFCHEREKAIAALQAAEPVAWQFYGDGSWHNGDRKIAGHRRNTEAAGIPVRDLFALPIPPTVSCQLYGHEVEGCGECSPPAKAQVPDEREAFEEWASDYWDFPDAVLRHRDGYALAQTQQYWQAWQARSMLTASPAPDHGEGQLEMVEVPFHMLALGTRFRYTSILKSEYVKISATQVARWQDDMAIIGWAGQGVYSFDEKDGTNTTVLVAVPTALRQQEEAER